MKTDFLAHDISHLPVRSETTLGCQAADRAVVESPVRFTDRAGADAPAHWLFDEFRSRYAGHSSLSR